VGHWLASVGAEVVQGDRLLELLAGEVVVDLSAPATGRLSEKRVAEGDVVTRGQVLGVIETDDQQECRRGPRAQ
jgi:pyruvate/2-oxoglutarate dehydrogenase complex dihydrolipoamide acyltransferase (E2) component